MKESLESDREMLNVYLQIFPRLLHLLLSIVVLAVTYWRPVWAPGL